MHFDATPAVEKALGWAKALRERSFVGTESRLNTVFELLRQMAFGAEGDPRVRLAELRRRRDAIDAEIEAVAQGRCLVHRSIQRPFHRQHHLRCGRIEAHHDIGHPNLPEAQRIRLDAPQDVHDPPVTYLSLSDPGFEVVFDDGQHERVRWCDTDGVQRSARIPRVIFTRAAAPEEPR